MRYVQFGPNGLLALPETPLSFLSCLRVRTLLIISWLFTIKLVSYSFKVAIIRANKQVILEGPGSSYIDG